MRNVGLDESQAVIKITGRNISNLRYPDDATLMAESEEELKSLLMRRESGKVRLKINIQKTKIMASGSITSWETDGGKVETVTDFTFLGSKITVDGGCRHEIKRCFLLGKKRYIKRRQCIKKQRHHFADNSCYCSVTKSCPTLCDPVDYSTSAFPVLHYILEFAQTLVHRVSDAILPSQRTTNNNNYFCFTQITLFCCNILF